MGRRGGQEGGAGVGEPGRLITSPPRRPPAARRHSERGSAAAGVGALTFQRRQISLFRLRNNRNRKLLGFDHKRSADPTEPRLVVAMRSTRNSPVLNLVDT